MSENLMSAQKDFIKDSPLLYTKFSLLHSEINIGNTCTSPK